VLPRGYKPVKAECVYSGSAGCASNCGDDGTQACTLQDQLLDVGAMTGGAFTPTIAAAAYADPAERVEKWRSENTGDIVILANMMEGEYYFDAEPKASQHGSLTIGDAIVPLAFSYPGASSEDERLDTVLNAVRDYLKSVAPVKEPAKSPVE